MTIAADFLAESAEIAGTLGRSQRDRILPIAIDRAALGCSIPKGRQNSGVSVDEGYDLSANSALSARTNLFFFTSSRLRVHQLPSASDAS
jgi:hypothetical protein